MNAENLPAEMRAHVFGCSHCRIYENSGIVLCPAADGMYQRLLKQRYLGEKAKA